MNKNIEYNATRYDYYKIQIQNTCCETLKQILESTEDNTISLSGSFAEPKLAIKLNHFDTEEDISFCPFCGTNISITVNLSGKI